ncbi:MAG: glutamine-hydrolyzing GMP synthase [Spirochaetales bacterium]
MDKILILDFGGQTCQLIGRRLREAGVYSEIISHDKPCTTELLLDVKGLVFSGSPYSVYEPDSPRVDPKFLQAGLPVLGICYGFQLLTETLGGKVKGQDLKEYGRVPLKVQRQDPLFAGVPQGFQSWMSHGDSIESLAPGFDLVCESDNHPAAAWDSGRRFWGIQFHPEVSHCEYGNVILSNFALGICGAKADWTMELYLEMEGSKIRSRVGSSPVLLLISGGVDSTVAGVMLLKILDPELVHLMYIDTGLMRANESTEVEVILRTLGAKHLHLIHAEARFLTALQGLADPEAKRKAIGDTFIRVQEEEVARLQLTDYFLAQGTLYTDLIESGKGVGKKAHVIKSHHNVGTPLVEAKRQAGRIIEPLEMLYKDEVRALGARLGLPEAVVWRHPFPGPGLGIRVLGEVTKEKCDILRQADALYLSELRRRNLYREIWQAFAVLLPVRSVGVTGDARDYGYVLALRAVTSKDGMTADVYDFPMKDLLEISSLITNQVRAVGRVTYDISSKPPSTIEWE